MKCPICQQEMKLTRNDESHNPETDTLYERKIYVCDKDDVWVTVELPKLEEGSPSA